MAALPQPPHAPYDRASSGSSVPPTLDSARPENHTNDPRGPFPPGPSPARGPSAPSPRPQESASPPGNNHPTPAQVQPDPTLLDPDETNSSDHVPHMEPEPDHRFDLCLTFRHSFWKARRQATHHAMTAAELSASTLERFGDCGSVAWVLQTETNPPNYTVAANICRSRWCEACQVERRRIIVRNIIAADLPDRLRFVTLTLKSCDAPLRDQIERLMTSFTRWRSNRDIRRSIQGGIWFLEIGRNENTGRWHPHLHLLTSGAFLPHAIASEHWRTVTGDSFIVDIRAVRDVRVAASYVMKYAAKSVSPAVWRTHEAFTEAIRSLHGRHLLSTFGSWRKLKLLTPPPPEHGWIPLARLDQVILRAQDGDAQAQMILRVICNARVHRTEDLMSVPPSQDHESRSPPDQEEHD